MSCGNGFLGDSGAGFIISNPSFINATKGYTRDAFGRIVVETPTTLFNAHPAFTPQYETQGYVSTGSGTVFLDISNTVLQLNANGTGGRAVRQSLEYLLYQPGKSQLVNMTVVPFYSGVYDTSVAQRFGIYDDYRDKNTPAGTTGSPPYLYQSSINGGTGQETNQPSMGHFFELSGNQWFVVERANSPDNTVNINRVPQRLWNIDTMDGNANTNPSGFTLTNGKIQTIVCFIERQWLGIGVVRMGFYFNGTPVFVHTFVNRELYRPYTHLPKLPIRYELEKVAGGSVSTATLATICASAHIMGDYTPLGAIFSLPGSVTLTSQRVGITQLAPIVLIRLQQQYCRASVKLKELAIYADIAGGYSIFKNPVITGGPITWTKNPDPRSLIEYCVFSGATTSAYTVSGGICTRSGFFDKAVTAQDSVDVSELLTAPTYCSDISGKPDILCVAAVGFAGNCDVRVNCRWIELV